MWPWFFSLRFIVNGSTSAAEKVRITGTGNVGIGTTSPQTKLQIGNGTALSTNLILGDANLGVFKDDGHAQLIISAGSGTNYEANLFLSAKNNTSGSRNFDITNGATVDTVRFRTLGDNGSAVNREIMAMNLTSGNVGIGTAGPTEKLHVVGNVLANSYLTPSSARWKTNIQPITGALDTIQQLRRVSYDWKADGKHDIGLIAEEVGAVIPQVVAYEENGKEAKSVDYSCLVAVLIEAMKEQQVQIKELKSEIERFKAYSLAREAAWAIDGVIRSGAAVGDGAADERGDVPVRNPAAQ